MKKEKKEWLGFYKQYKLHQACATDCLRPAMEYICIRDGYAYATDGHIIVRASLHNISALSDDDINKLNGYFIHMSHWPLLLKYNTIEIGKGTISLKGENGVTTVINLSCGFKYPEVEKYFTEESLAKSGSVPAIGISFKLLARLRAAMGLDNKMELHFTSQSSAIYVKGEDAKYIDVKGMIMPMLLSE